MKSSVKNRPRPKPTAVAPRPRRDPLWLLAGLLVLVTIAIYWPVARHDFINYDDPAYVASNIDVQNGLTWHNVQWAFCHPVVGNWHPVTILSHMLDCQIYGLKPWGHHLTNVLLHAANTALVFLLLLRLTGALWRSWMVAALFGLHPLHVESVAWVAERKDVLSTFFALLSLLCYAYYAHGKGESSSPALRSSSEGGSSSNPQSTINPQYLLSLLFFALGLMSKPMLVTLPFVLLLLDYWPLQRFIASGAATDSTIQRFNISTLIEKLPFFTLAAAICVVTYMVQQQTGTMDSLETVSMATRVGNALVSYCRYLGKLFWPTNLAVFYPYHVWPMDGVLLAGIVMTGISAFVFFQRTHRPYLLTGWLWFCGTLVPVIGLVQVGGQAMADRYTYIPSLGIFVLVVWGAWELAKRWKHHAMALAGAGCIAAILCAGLTWRQLSYWQNDETLYRHALAVTKDNYRAHLNLGVALVKEGNFDEAIVQYQEALRLKPDRAEAHYNLGAALAAKGQTDDALTEFRQAAQLQPNDPTALADLGAALARQGELNEAKAYFQKALQITPQDALLHNNWGKVLLEEGQCDAAIQEFQKALSLQPNFALAMFNLGDAERQSGNLDAAIEQWQRATALDPDYAAAYNNLGNAMMQRGQFDVAIRQFQLALKSQPDFADAMNNLAGALLQEGQVAEAVQEWEQALTLRPDFAPTLNNLAWVLATCPDDSLRDGAKALQFAQHANQLSKGGNPLSLRALAAAYAENGGFENAVSNAQLAVQLAALQNRSGLAQSIQEQLEYYRRHQPFRDSAMAPRESK